MKDGHVFGVVIKPNHVLVVVQRDNDPDYREQVIRLCLSNESKAIRVGDFLWTQSDSAYWSSENYKIKDVKLPLHRTLWNGKHPCCNAPDSDAEVPK